MYFKELNYLIKRPVRIFIFRYANKLLPLWGGAHLFSPLKCGLVIVKSGYPAESPAKLFQQSHACFPPYSSLAQRESCDLCRAIRTGWWWFTFCSSGVWGGPRHQFVNTVAFPLSPLCGEMRCKLEFQAGSWPNIESVFFLWYRN